MTSRTRVNAFFYNAKTMSQKTRKKGPGTKIGEKIYGKPHFRVRKKCTE
jgi:hypothetical protein